MATHRQHSPPAQVSALKHNKENIVIDAERPLDVLQLGEEMARLHGPQATVDRLAGQRDGNAHRRSGSLEELLDVPDRRVVVDPAIHESSKAVPLDIFRPTY